MDKRYLWKRSNVYWVRVRVPDDVRDIIGKCQLSKNLYTKDIEEANRTKHKVVSGMMEIGWLRRTIHIPQLRGILQENGIFTWRLSDCEELEWTQFQERNLI